MTFEWILPTCGLYCSGELVAKEGVFYFEDFLTMKYQVQEMLRVERIFEAKAIEEELAIYNPLIPDGRNLKATFMIEYPDAAQRQQALVRMGGVENTVYLTGRVPIKYTPSPMKTWTARPRERRPPYTS